LPAIQKSNRAMDTLAAVFVTIGLLCMCLFWPAGIGLMVIGLLLCILSATNPKLRRRPSGPACRGPLGDQEPQLCLHCRTKLFWTHEGDPLTREQFQAYAHRERVWAKERAQRAQSVGERANLRAIEWAERREEWAERAKQVSWAVVAWIVRPFVRL
jgi:hypothetical protein